MYWIDGIIRTFAGGLLLIAMMGAGAPLAHAQGGGTRAVPEVLIYADSRNDATSEIGADQMVVLVDKSRQQVNLYGFRGYWRNLAQWPCSTGKIKGPKKMEGDRKTPEGLYFVTRDVGERYLTPIYGVRALPLDYPNWLDRRHENGGSAIWLHGTNKPLQARDSNGCVVMDNQSINQLARHIRLQKTPVIIVDRIRLRSEKRSRVAAGMVLTAMDQWHRAMMYGDYAGFSHWYAQRSKPSMAWWQRWCRQRREFGRKDAYRSVMRNRTIFRLDDVYVMLFDHVLMHGNRESWAGRRKLYLVPESGEVRIVGDTYQPGNRKGADPLFMAWRKLYPHVFEQGNLVSGKAGGQGG